MFDLAINLDEITPPHIVLLSVSADGAELSVSVSPNVEAAVLVALDRQIAEAVASAVDSFNSGGGDTDT